MSTAVGAKQCHVVCQACHNNVKTKVTHRSTTKTHLLALLLCCIGCCPCAVCLYCTGCARNVDHHCPECKNFIGVYER